jgi:hypothetical protein
MNDEKKNLESDEVQAKSDLSSKLYGEGVEEKVKLAIKTMKQKYGVVGLDNMYLLATDIDGDLRIAPMGLLDKMLWECGASNANSFIKIKELIATESV